MLVKHVYDYVAGTWVDENGVECTGFVKRPFATIVATGPNRVGISFCNAKDAFVKKVGVEFAKHHANKTPVTLDNYKDVLVPNGVVYDMRDGTGHQKKYVVMRELYNLLQRSRRYYQE